MLSQEEIDSFMEDDCELTVSASKAEAEAEPWVRSASMVELAAHTQQAMVRNFQRALVLSRW